jgi:hypothetical protein
MNRHSLALAVLVLFTACAGPSASGPQAEAVVPPKAPTLMTKAEKEEAKKKSDWTCLYEKPTGSNIPEKVCRPKTDAERGQIQDAVRTVPSMNMRPGG